MDVAGDGMLATNFETSRLTDTAGRPVATFDPPVFGSFDPSGRYVSLMRGDEEGNPMLWIHDTAAPNGDIQPRGLSGGPILMQWDPGGRLVVGVDLASADIVNPDDPVEFFVCTPDTGECQPIAGSRTYGEAVPALSSNGLGQLAAWIGS